MTAIGTNVTEVRSGIFEYEMPLEMYAGKWLETHLDCDTIVDDLGERIVVYAYSSAAEYNAALSDFRREKYPRQYVMRGIPSDALNGIYLFA